MPESVEVLKKRLENLDRANQNLESLRARLLRIESSILLIQEQALTRSDPSFIEAEVKAATAGLDTSEEMLRMMELPVWIEDPGFSTTYRWASCLPVPLLAAGAGGRI